MVTALVFELLIAGRSMEVQADPGSGWLAVRTARVGANEEARELCRR